MTESKSQFNIFLETYENVSASGWESQLVRTQKMMPAGSRIIDLKFQIGQEKEHDFLEFEITTQQGGSSYRIYSDMLALVPDETYHYNCLKSSTEKLARQISHPRDSAYWDPCVLRTHVAEYLAEKYQFTREPIIVTLYLVIGGQYMYASYSNSSKSNQYKVDDFVLDPLMTFGTFKTLIKSALDDKKMFPFEITGITLDRDSKYCICRDNNFSRIPNTFKGGKDDNFLILNRLANGYVLQVNVHTVSLDEKCEINKDWLHDAIRKLSLVKKDHVIVKFERKFVKDEHRSILSQQTMDIFYAHKHKSLDWFRYALHPEEKRKVKLIIKLQDKEPEYSDAVHHFLIQDIGEFQYQILDKVPLDVRPPDEIKKLAQFQFRDNLAKAKKLLPVYSAREMERRQRMYHDAVPRDFTLVLTDEKGNDLYSTAMSSGIVMLHTGKNKYHYGYREDPKFSVNMLEAFFSKKSTFADTKEGAMKINIHDFMFQSFSLDQHIDCLEAAFRYCYLGDIDCITMDFLLENYLCLQTWAAHLHLGEFYDRMEELIDGEFIEKHADQLRRENDSL